LAVGAKIGAPVSDRDALDSGLAPAASLSTSVGNIEFVLMSPRLAVSVSVVGDGSAAIADGSLKHLNDGSVKLRYLLLRQSPCRPEGVDAGQKQSFIGIHIADASEESLIAEHSLDRGSMSA